MKSAHWTMTLLAPFVLQAVVHSQDARVHVDAGGGPIKITNLPGGGVEVRQENKAADGKAEATATASGSSSNQSSQTTNIDGKTVTITRSRNPNGKETVTVTTIGRNGRPKVETLSADEFEKKYGARKSKLGKARTEAEPAEAPPPAKPAATGQATE